MVAAGGSVNRAARADITACGDLSVQGAMKLPPHSSQTLQA
jgi:hypothetical protein